MPRHGILRGLDALTDAARQTSSERIGLDANVLIGSPGVAHDRVAIDAVETARSKRRNGCFVNAAKDHYRWI
jgi:hypothetical protein